MSRLRAVCPASPAHAEFFSSARVVEMWRVDRDGNWLSTVEGQSETEERPHPGRAWECAECGSRAEFRDDEEG